MTKDFFNACMKKEVYLDHNPRFHARIWLKYFKPETNAVYLIRRFQRLIGGGTLTPVCQIDRNHFDAAVQHLYC